VAGFLSTVFEQVNGFVKNVNVYGSCAKCPLCSHAVCVVMNCK